MSTTTFEEARPGDRVWDALYGWGTVFHWQRDEKIIVKFDNGPTAVEYRLSGFYCNGTAPQRTLYWKELFFEIPLAPKHKVKKTFWLKVCLTSNQYPIPSHGMYVTKEYALADPHMENDVWQTVPVEIEVEE